MLPVITRDNELRFSNDLPLIATHEDLSSGLLILTSIANLVPVSCIERLRIFLNLCLSAGIMNGTKISTMSPSSLNGKSGNIS